MNLENMKRIVLGALRKEKKKRGGRMMVYKDGDYIYKEAEFKNVDVVVLKGQDSETRVVIDDHFSGEQLADFKVIEEEE